MKDLVVKSRIHTGVGARGRNKSCCQVHWERTTWLVDTQGIADQRW